MNPCDIMRSKFLDMLQTGVRHTFDGETTYLPYETILKFMCTSPVPRLLFLSAYQKLPPIEAYPREEKDEWKKFINEIFPGTPPSFRLEAVKIVYAIGVLSN